MSEEKKSFMQELDPWSETNVIDRLLGNDGNPDEYVGEETIQNRLDVTGKVEVFERKFQKLEETLHIKL